MKFYLSGAMEYAPDSGEKWRTALQKFLKQELDASVFNPLEEGPKVLFPVSVEEFRDVKFSDIRLYTDLVRKLIDRDIRTIAEDTTAVICYWDRYAGSGGGTQGELTVAREHNIPVYMVTEIPLTEISGWIIGCATEIFPDFDTLKSFLIQTYDKMDPENCGSKC